MRQKAVSDSEQPSKLATPTRIVLLQTPERYNERIFGNVLSEVTSKSSTQVCQQSRVVIAEQTVEVIRGQASLAGFAWKVTHRLAPHARVHHYVYPAQPVQFRKDLARDT